VYLILDLQIKHDSSACNILNSTLCTIKLVLCNQGNSEIAIGSHMAGGRYLQD